MWLHFFPRVWRILSDKQRETVGAEMVPFICSGAHVIQRDCHPSALNTFLEALARCNPPVPIKPSILKYLGKSHNLWHRSTLLLEQIAFENHPMGALPSPSANKARGGGGAGLFSQEASQSGSSYQVLLLKRHHSSSMFRIQLYIYFTKDYSTQSKGHKFCHLMEYFEGQV